VERLLTRFNATPKLPAGNRGEMERKEALDMKTMTGKDLTGACDLEFQVETFDKIAEMSKKHRMEMFEQGDRAHLDAMGKMKALMS